MVRHVAHLAMALALLTMFLAPTGLADHRPACEEATVQETDAPAYVEVRGGDVELWEETNELPGLQRVGCTDEDGVHHPRDSKTGEVGKSNVDEAVDFVWTVEAFVCTLYNNPTPPSFEILCPRDLV